jgi:NAD(P)-dependent dehydrogenase (short-subunit alcohol dehydrogenase family)
VGRCALITGAGSGIGAAIARRLAADGFDVCLTGRRIEPLQALAGELGGIAVAADTSVAIEIEAAVSAAIERYGRLDALICSAGAGAGGGVAEQTLERWNRVIATNLTGVFLAARAAIPHLVASRGTIVTISSLAGLRVSPASAAYCASKAGMIMLTQSIALDYGPRGVRANCLCPGWIRTEMADRAMEALAEELGTVPDEAQRIAVAEVPARRMGTTDEVADAVAWLASPGAAYVNGAVITIDGGAAIVDAGSLAFADAPPPPAPRA